MSVGQEFWIVATSCAGGDKSALLRTLQGAGNKLSTPGHAPRLFDVPDGDKSLVFGSFDNLIRLTDDLQKIDGQVESITHRIERQFLELDEKAVFKVKSRQQEKDVFEYLNSWSWDDARFPKTRSIVDTAQVLMTNVNRLDEQSRTGTATYNEFKSQRGNIAKKDSPTLLTKDLVDVFTPAVVSMHGKADDDFIYSEHLTTVCVVLSRGADQDFLKVYETMCENVVPESAKHFQKHDDKDGNMVWRAIMFKSAVEPFKRQCRERRWLPREFEYSEDGYKKLMAQRQEVEKAVKRQHDIVTGLYQLTWSDAMVAWTHIKAMRVFVESVLRFGMPPRFASFIICPKQNAMPAARKALADIMGKSQGGYDKMAAGEKQEDDEEYFPYVSLPFVPFNAQRG